MGFWILQQGTAPILRYSITPCVPGPDDPSRKAAFSPGATAAILNHSLQSAAVWDNGADPLYECQTDFAL
jgi:hypothetical protein